ncbi:MAG: hypothetical protein H7835_20440, partial [Magnetococcus sp. XQGC-1]
GGTDGDSTAGDGRNPSELACGDDESRNWKQRACGDDECRNWKQLACGDAEEADAKNRRRPFCKAKSQGSALDPPGG